MYLFKPRTTYWEHLFFGNTSPLAEVFKDSVLREYFCISRLSLDGRVLQREVPSVSSLPFDFYKFGYLACYCFCLGIQDLHYQNLVPTAHGLQPVDIEVVLSNLVAPSQTLLVPGKNISFAKSGLGKFFQSISELSQFDVEYILKGFYDGAVFLRDSASTMTALLNREAELFTQPNRVIFMDTKAYKEASDFLTEEERIQIARGDIPYFFKLINTSKIYYYYLDGLETMELMNPPEKYLKIANSVGHLPEFLLSSNRINGSLFPIGLLSLIASFRSCFDGDTELSLAENVAIEIKETGAEIHLEHKSYRLNY